MQQAAVIGSGYMGGGIAQVLAIADFKVKIADVSVEESRHNLQRLVSEATQFVADGLFPPGSVEKITSNIAVAASIEEAVTGADYIEEAVPEVIDIKHETLRQISLFAKEDAIIGSNTSTISIARLAEAVTCPERFLGVHFSNPSPFIPGVEVIPHEHSSDEVINQACSIVHRTGKETAIVKDVTGFVLNRLQYALFHEATQLVEEGVATPEAIDVLVRTTFGFRLPFFGPFAIADMAGLDVYNFCYKSLQTSFPERFATPEILASLINEGKLGVKTGSGFLNVSPDRLNDLVEYRNKAYVKMQELLDELGPPPLVY